MKHSFRSAKLGRETFSARLDMPRHRHLDAYATVVLAGVFEESGFGGRVRAAPGDVLIHAALDAHGDRMLSKGATLLRLPWPNAGSLEGTFSICDPDALARAGERSPIEAAMLLETMLADARRSPSVISDWPDALACDLSKRDGMALHLWADSQRLAPETVSRGFKSAYGISPASYRLELKARSAWRMIVRGTAPLARVAMDSGFADQAHMTRAVHRITGSAPMQWRAWARIRDSTP